ncbi:MAG: hypothetical protein JNM36_06485 [Chitinophagales bacterium]|nr:hypothetical protein [Chitinophagales bacterium]
MAIIGAFTEYAGIIGNKMLFEDMSFSEANESLTWKDAIDISVAASFGAAKGTLDGGATTFATWIAKPTNQKIVKKLADVGISTVEGWLKVFLKQEDFDLKSVLAGALTEVGLGDLLSADAYKNVVEKATKNASAATKRVEKLATRKTPNQKLINTARKQAANEKTVAKITQTLDVTHQAVTGGVAKTNSNKAQNVAKTEKPK